MFIWPLESDRLCVHIAYKNIWNFGPVNCSSARPFCSPLSFFFLLPTPILCVKLCRLTWRSTRSRWRIPSLRWTVRSLSLSHSFPIRRSVCLTIVDYFLIIRWNITKNDFCFVFRILIPKHRLWLHINHDLQLQYLQSSPFSCWMKLS